MPRKLCELKWDERRSIGNVFHTATVGLQMVGRVADTDNGKYVITMFIQYGYDIGDNLDFSIRRTYNNLEKAKSVVEMICKEELDKISEPI